VLGRLRPLLDGAAERVGRASLTQDEAARILRGAEAEVRALAQEVDSHDEELRRLDAIMSAAADRLAGQRRRRERRETALAALDDELARAREALASAQRAAAEEAAALPARRAALDETRRAASEAESAASEARRAESEATTAATAAQMEARSARERALAARLRLEEAEGGIADAESALAGLEDRRAALANARARAEAVARGAHSAGRRGALWRARAESNADAARAAAEEGDRRLVVLRTRERELSDGLDEATRRRNEAEVRRAQYEARKQAIGERSRDDWGLSLEELASFETFRPEEEAAARERVEKLDRDLKRFGAVNPRAGEEYAELAERETFLVAQIEDLKASKHDLLKVLHEVDETIVEVFGDAFAAVALEFDTVFQRLFPGGTGRLTLTDPNDLLASGIEVEARPAGKNVRKLSLLSGGERSLVALAYLFSIFRARPSPFYLLDEVEAALDDVNLQRFLGLVAELEERAQVLIVTHQKRTMEAADVLYGVSMAAEGVSLVIAKRMEDPERTTA
jgi:chromosome segregation protein